MKISQLKYFATLAELQNVSRASELLHMSQSSLSKNISSIEDELGMSLFDRNGKHIALNSAGQRFLECCRKMLHEYEKTLDDINTMSTGSNNRISIGTCGNISKLIPCMTEFKSIYPEVEFSINSNIEGEDSVDINEYDMLIYPSEPKYSRFNGFPLFEEKYYLAVSKSDPLSKTAAVSLRALNNRDVIFMRCGKVSEHTYDLCSALSIHFNSNSFVTSRSMHRDSIASNLGIGFVPESYSSLYTSSGNIQLLPITDNGFSRSFNICFKRKKHLGKLAQEFEALICKRFGFEESTM